MVKTPCQMVEQPASLSLICRLRFPVYCSLNNILLSLRSSTHWGCIQTMLNAGLPKAFCVNIIMHVFGFPLFLLFILWLFPLPPSHGCRLPSRIAALQFVAGEVLGRLGGRVL